MKILVDADSCPVKNIILDIAKHYGIEVYMFFDTSHIYDDHYSKVIIVDKGKDSVDFELIKYIKNDDIVITQDYGVACMALTKKAYVINQDGLIFTNDNIESLLYNRFLSQKAREAKLKTTRPKKRLVENDQNFKTNFLSLVQNSVH